jgi:hypothetical protein
MHANSSGSPLKKTNPEIKAQFEKQAESYRNLVERRERFLRGALPKFSN